MTAGGRCLGPRIPGSVRDWQKAWRTFLAWLWKSHGLEAGGAEGTWGAPLSGSFYLLRFRGPRRIPPSSHGLRHLQYCKQPAGLPPLHSLEFRPSAASLAWDTTPTLGVHLGSVRCRLTAKRLQLQIRP